MSVGDRIREEREALGLNQTEFAGAVGFSRETINKWETGKSVPTMRNMRFVAEFLEIPVSSLMGIEEKEKDTPWKRETDDLLAVLSDISPEFVWDMRRAFTGKTLTEDEGRELIRTLRQVLQWALNAAEH